MRTGDLFYGSPEQYSTPASGRMPLASSSSSTVTKRYPSACRAVSYTHLTLPTIA